MPIFLIFDVVLIIWLLTLEFDKDRLKARIQLLEEDQQDRTLDEWITSEERDSGISIATGQGIV